MSEFRTKLDRDILPLVARPSRYIGGERNAAPKDDEGVAVRFLLAFPDVYEIGMSHLGIRVLYDILNRRPDVAAERAFAPWMDMEARMREARVPLFSLETTRPAREFDLIGFTLQYELQYTNVLTMLDLAEVPLRAAERGEGDPLVVGGGPAAFNPEPVAEFFDLIVVGDGETAVLDLADLVIRARADGAPRAEVLRRAAGIAGVYVPSLYRAEHDGGGRFAGTVPVDASAHRVVARRVEPSLDYASHPSCPIVPITEATHDRLALEIMRGCTRGCRFCQAGMVTRPVRTRTADDLARLADEGLAASGYDEVSLLSLSPSDHPELGELVSKLNERLFDKRVSISLPSLRVDRFSLELADGIGRVRRSGLTFAPEAGTQRLRDVINKNETEEHILDTVDVAFASGWSRIKLYFMIGLPTETDRDLEGIGTVVKKVRDVARARRRGAAISVSISPFVPRPATPFQWERQDAMPETRRKERLLRSLLMIRGVKLSLRDPRVSLLEGVMARGDRRLASTIEAAWRGGARFDGWTESFNFGIWERAFAEVGIDAETYLAGRDPAAPLPWDHISSGVSKEYLIAERAKAFRAETTADCREVGCLACGACNAADATPRALPPLLAAGAGARAESLGRRDRKMKNGAEEPAAKYRVRYVKGEAARFLSHLDIVRAISRAIAVGSVPAAFSRGFNPHPKLSFGPPLPVGAAGDAEFFDIELVREVPADELAARLASGLPRGLSVVSVARRAAGGSVSSDAEAAEYVIRRIPGHDALSAAGVRERIAALMAAPSAVAVKGRAGRDAGDGSRAEAAGKEFVPAREIIALTPLPGEPAALRAVLRLPPGGSVRPSDIVRLLAVQGAGPAELAFVRRTALLRRNASAPGGLEAIS
jgi:radical SAM family uncharacterized protein/radical SAM-linked protein